jgi:hypothetical protein
LEGNLMARRDGTKGTRDSGNPKVRRCGVVLGGAVGAFVAAAAMATGSAAPAKADIDDFLDPIIQPILTQVTDSISGFDPTLATDLTTWTDTFLADLNSLDPTAAASSTAATAAASSASDAASDPTGGEIPITMEEDTEPTVQATVDGSPTTLLVDTGSSGLVIPWDDLGFLKLLELGFPTGGDFSAYSGGVGYYYLTYDTTVDYGGVVTTTDTPVDVEIFSFPTSLNSPDSFELFDQDNDVTGVLGIGDSASAAGPTESPLQAAGFNGVTVDIPKGELVIGSNADENADNVTVSGAPTSTLYESIDGGAKTQVSDDVDSGGVYGTIPSSLVGNATSVPSGQTISVYDSSGEELYSYVTGTDSLGTDTSPGVTSGTSIDSGVEPYLEEPIYLDYQNDTLTFDEPPGLLD